LIPAGIRVLNREYRVSRIMSQRPVLTLTGTSTPEIAAADGVSRYETEP
jgi:hypothetical protein